MRVDSGHPHTLVSIASWCGVFVALVYFVRGTVLPWYLPVPATAWIAANVLTLLVGSGLVILSGGSWRGPWVAVMLMLAASLTQAEQFIVCAGRCCGLVLLIIAVGPAVLNRSAAAARSAAWRITTTGLTTLTAVFVFWYVLRLPSLGGRIYFTAFMNQSMLLGPIAGLGVVIASVRAIHGRSLRWGLLATTGLIPLLASGSRLAALATAAPGCLLLLRRVPALGVLTSLLLLTTIYGFMTRNEMQSDDETVSFTSALSRKGNANSRTDLWQCRIDEFKSSPLLGIGVAMGTGSGSVVEANGDIRVEPGSSYLAVLAMTGALGFITLLSALGRLLVQFGFAKSSQKLHRDILIVVGIFLAVHGVAEGWIFGFGSPLCFLFWLWLGNVGDAAVQPGLIRAVKPFGSRRSKPNGWRTPASVLGVAAKS